MLKYKIADLNDVEESLQGFYTEKDGEYVLQVEGGKPDSEISGLTSALKKERENSKVATSRLNKFGDVTPEDFNLLSDEIANLKAKDSRDVDALFTARMLPFEREKEQLKVERDNSVKELSNLKDKMMNSSRDNVINELANGKIKSEFLRDAKLRAKYELTFNEDVKDFVTSEGVKADDWFAKQILETPSWELNSLGSGAKGGSTITNSKTNPWVDGTLDERANIIKSNPALAERLKSEAKS